MFFEYSPLQVHVQKMCIALCVFGIVLLLIFLNMARLQGILQGALFQVNPGFVPPTTGIYVGRGYEALPNERGSIVLQTGQTLTNLEGLSVTIVVDPARATILRVRRTAATQSFDISVDFPAPGMAKVALVGAPKTLAPQASLLEVQLQLANNNINTTGNRVDIRLLGVEYLMQSTSVGSLAHEGYITIVSNQNALTLPSAAYIADIDPGVYPLVRNKKMMIRGRALPPLPRVILGTHPIPVVSSSPTEIVAMIPEDFAPGTYTVTVESLLADEKIVVFEAPPPSGSVDILEELLFTNPNPVLYGAGEEDAEVFIWIPVHNPLGAENPIFGTVDFSSVAGIEEDPIVTFEGKGEPGIGPSGERVNWFRAPSGSSFKLPSFLETDVDYPIVIRVENGVGTTDTAVEMLKLRSIIPQGHAPFFGQVQMGPPAPKPGDSVAFFVDVTDNDGITGADQLLIVLSLVPIGQEAIELKPVLNLPVKGAPIKTVPYTTRFTIPSSLHAGTYQLELFARDFDGNETRQPFELIVGNPSSDLGPPVFSGRLEAFPPVVQPGGKVDFFAGIADPDGTKTIDLVTIDLINIGGGIEELTSLIPLEGLGTLPAVFSKEFTIPESASPGTYQLSLRAVDENSKERQAVITLQVSPVGSQVGSPPIFSGRLEAEPATVAPGNDVNFFVGIADPNGTDTINQVIIDLIDIGGAIETMQPILQPVSGSTQPSVFTKKFTVPRTVVNGLYSLQIRVTDDHGNVALTTLPLLVSDAGVQGGVPQILRVDSLPAHVPADNETEVAFTVDVEDSDGIEDIEIVTINLTPINLPLKSLRLTSPRGSQTTRGIYESDRVRIPTSVRNGGYDLAAEVEDKQGHRVKRNLRLIVGPGSLGGDAPLVREARFVPEIARPGQDIRLFIEVEDENGVNTVTAVADLTDLRLDVEELDQLIDFPGGTLVTQNTFASGRMRVPDDVPVGVYDIPLTIVDDTNNIVIAGARLRIERGGETEGHPPLIDVQRSFQVPRVIANDEKSGNELHVLVHDSDNDVLTVIANLRDIAKGRSASISDGVGDIALLCNESRSIACMQPGVAEGTAARWFVLRDITVPETTLPTADPYYIELTAIDREGHTHEDRVPLQIGGSETQDLLQATPRLLALVPVDQDEIELVLSSPVDSRSVDRAGGQFRIRPTLNALSSLSVKRVSWDTTGRILYLQTDPLTPGETYTFDIDSSGEEGVPVLRNIYGNRYSAAEGGTLVFAAFTPPGEKPVIRKVQLVDKNHIDVHFDRQVIPSSVHTDVLPSRVHLRSVVTGTERTVQGGLILNDAKTLRLRVDDLREGDRYELRLEGVLGPGILGTPSPGLIETFFSLFPRAEELMPLILPTADLNRDARVDFADFSLFSAVYDTEYSLDSAEQLEGEQEEESQPRSAAPPEPCREDQGGVAGTIPCLNIGGSDLPTYRPSGG